MNIVDFGVLMVDETLDTIKSEQWREMNAQQRRQFIDSWNRRGIASFCCIKCGYPTVHGQSGCEACE